MSTESGAFTIVYQQNLSKLVIDPVNSQGHGILTMNVDHFQGVTYGHCSILNHGDEVRKRGRDTQKDMSDGQAFWMMAPNDKYYSDVLKPSIRFNQ